MNWDALGAIAELVGAVAVLLTLIYLAIQIRQNSEVTKFHVLQAESSLESFLLDYSEFIFNNPKAAESRQKFAELVQTEDPAGLEWSHFLEAKFSLLPLKTAIQNSFFRYKKGFIAESVYISDTVVYLEEFGGHMLLLNLPMTDDFKEEVRRVCRKANDKAISRVADDDPLLPGLYKWRDMIDGKWKLPIS